MVGANTPTYVGELHPVTDADMAEPDARATCVDCLETLVSKCGEINRWHWAHEASASLCVGESGQESAWHVAWKQWAANTIGAPTEVKHGRHRADIVALDGQIIELQSDYLDARKIREREDTYGDRLTWIYRMTPGRFSRLRNVGDGWFRWGRGSMAMASHEAPVIWHHHDRLYGVTIKADDGVMVKFSTGEPDRYGPVLYGSEPAPFNVADALTAVDRFTTEAIA